MFKPGTIAELQLVVNPEVLQQIIAARALISTLDICASDFKKPNGFSNKCAKALVRLFTSDITEHDANNIIALVCAIDTNEDNIVMNGFGGSSVKSMQELVDKHLFQ